MKKSRAARSNLANGSSQDWLFCKRVNSGPSDFRSLPNRGAGQRTSKVCFILWRRTYKDKWTDIIQRHSLFQFMAHELLNDFSWPRHLKNPLPSFDKPYKYWFFSYWPLQKSHDLTCVNWWLSVIDPEMMT